MLPRRALAFGLMLVGLAWPAAPATAQEPAELAFESGERIWSLAADGSGRVALTPRPTRRAKHLVPEWAPDGSELVMMRLRFPFPRSDHEGSAQLVARSQTGEIRALTVPRRGISDSEPSWSPDSRLLTFTRQTRRVQLLMVLDLETGMARTVARYATGRRFEFVRSPRFYPDGQRLLYTRMTIDRRNHFRYALEAINLDGSGRTLVARDAHSGVFSPDGSQIAVSSIRDRNGEDCGGDTCDYIAELYVMNADGTDARRLTRNKGSDIEPSWSSDGSRIAFASNRNAPGYSSGFELYSIRPDGGCLTWLTNGTPYSASPSWRPGAGSPDPGACGAVDRAPLVGIDARGVFAQFPSQVFWFGEEHRGAVVSDTERGGRRFAFINYGDCGRFDPGDCILDLQLTTAPICSSSSYELDAIRRARSIRAFRGALLIDHGPNGIDVLTGRTTVSMLLGSLRIPSPGLRRSALRALRPLSAERPPARLARPVIPRVVVDLVRRAQRARRRFATLDAAAQALKISTASVRGALRLGRVLRRFGSVRTALCSNIPPFTAPPTPPGAPRPPG